MGFDWHNLEVLTLQPRHVADQIWIETWHDLADIFDAGGFLGFKNVHTPSKNDLSVSRCVQWRVNVPFSPCFWTPSNSFFGFPLVGNFEPFPNGPFEQKTWISISQDPHQEGAQQHAKSKYPKYWVGFGGRATSHGLWIWFSMTCATLVEPKAFESKISDDHSICYFYKTWSSMLVSNLCNQIQNKIAEIICQLNEWKGLLQWPSDSFFGSVNLTL